MISYASKRMATIEDHRLEFSCLVFLQRPKERQEVIFDPDRLVLPAADQQDFFFRKFFGTLDEIVLFPVFK